jgi:FkbM family methyltransferase
MSLLEKIVRSNIYLYLLSKYLYSKFFYYFFFEKEFKILQKINRKFKNNKIILDIGANNGNSAKTIRIFEKKSKILSFEPNKIFYKELSKLKKKINFFNFKIVGGDNFNNIKYLYIPVFKNFFLDSQASVSEDLSRDSVKRGIFDKSIWNKINFKKIKCNFVKIDKFKAKPYFIKIDTEGSEHKVLEGLKDTIKKYKPVIMVEKNQLNYKRIIVYLRSYDYRPYLYQGKVLVVFKNAKNTTQDHSNIIFICKKNINEIF